MKALRTMGVVAFFMLSACASNREGYAIHQPDRICPINNSTASESSVQGYSSGQVHFVAYGQVLSYWASQLK